MGKNKTVNPADAHRKAQRKKELQKNKDVRKKARELTQAKTDLGPIEEEIGKLESKGDLTGQEQSRLSSLKADLERIRKAKEDYVKEHPEQKRLIYASGSRSRKEKEDQEDQVRSDRRIFGKDGLPIHPERSIYYDPVMNPYGIPPPGLPYLEHPMVGEKVNSDDDSSDEDVEMPEGPPPDEWEDDIPLPPGSPPHDLPPLPPGPPPVELQPSAIGMPPPPLGLPPPPFIGIPPPPPLGFAPPSLGIPPPPPIGFHQPVPPSTYFQPPVPFFPSMPLEMPRGFQRVNPDEMPHINLRQPNIPIPPKPNNNSLAIDDRSSAATISAAPQLRDLKKEATAFVPRGLQAKSQPKQGNSRVNAAPGTDSVAESDTRPDLMKTLVQAGIAGPTAVHAKPAAESRKKGDDDYSKFMSDMGDLLTK